MKLKRLAILTLTIILFILIINFSYSNTYAVNLNEVTIKAAGAELIDSERGQILYQKANETKFHVSIANKIMTAIIALEKAKPDSKVTVSNEASKTDGSVLGLASGDKYNVEDLVYSIILLSANDSCIALAENVGGDVQKFVELMNNKALELNLKNTHFENPTGMYNKAQYTTAHDLSQLVLYSMKNPSFERIFSTKSRLFTYNKGNTQIMLNQNNLFWDYEGVCGGKIGNSEQNLQAAVTVANKNGLKLIATVINSPAEIVLQDSSKLLDFGHRNFMRDILVPKNQTIKSIALFDQQINLISHEDIYYTFPKGENYIDNADFNLSKNVKPPITTDQVIGTLSYKLKDNSTIDVNLYPEKEIQLPDNPLTYITKKLTENRDLFILLVILVIIELLIVVYKFLTLLDIKKYFSFVHLPDKMPIYNQKTNPSEDKEPPESED